MTLSDWQPAQSKAQDRLDAITALFSGPQARSVFRDGVQFLEVPVAELKAALGEEAPSVTDEQVASLAAILGGAIEQHISSAEYRLSRLPEGEVERRRVLNEQLDRLRAALEYRKAREEEALG